MRRTGEPRNGRDRVRYHTRWNDKLVGRASNSTLEFLFYGEKNSRGWKALHSLTCKFLNQIKKFYVLSLWYFAKRDSRKLSFFVARGVGLRQGRVVLWTRPTGQKTVIKRLTDYSPTTAAPRGWSGFIILLPEINVRKVLTDLKRWKAFSWNDPSCSFSSVFFCRWKNRLARINVSCGCSLVSHFSASTVTWNIITHIFDVLTIKGKPENTEAFLRNADFTIDNKNRTDLRHPLWTSLIQFAAALLFTWLTCRWWTVSAISSILHIYTHL